MKKTLVFLALITLAQLMSSAYAGISINNLLLFMTPKDEVQNLAIQNTDPQNVAYVKIVPQLLTNPGEEPEKLTSSTLTTNPQMFGLLVSPLKMAIPAGAQRDIRLVNLFGTPKIDRTYYLSIVPVSQSSIEATNGATKIDLNIQSNYLIKVILLPANPLPQIAITRAGTTVTISNSGNSYISLRNGQLCDLHGNQCAPLPSDQNYYVLFAKKTWVFQIAHPGVVKFDGVYNEIKTMPVASS